MNKLWNGGSELNSFIEAFETGDDLVLDQKLVPYDVYGSLAHAAGLEAIGIVTSDEHKKIKKALAEVLVNFKKGKFLLEMGDEDVHTKIEQFVTDNYGEVGKKIHTGRSRNDQVLTDLRLFQKDKLLHIWEQLLIISQNFADYAIKYEFVPLPGYTHMQKAMPTTVGMWAGSFAESLCDDLEVLKTAFKLNNQSPLGSAAGFGVPLKLDRELTAQLLGFAIVQNNSIYCQNSRGKFEFSLISALVAVIMTLNKFASDVLFFTSSELGYFAVNNNLTTGSSIMPQKKNVDVAELIRSKAHLLIGNLSAVASMSTNLISGYNRDIQDSKKIVFDSLEMTLNCLKATGLLLGGLVPNVTKLKQAMTPELFATHKTLNKTLSGSSFRDVYRYTSKHLDTLEDVKNEDLKQLFLKSSHPGGTGNLGLTQLKKYIKQQQADCTNEKKKFDAILNQLVSS